MHGLLPSHLRVQLAGRGILPCQHRLQRRHTGVDDDQIPVDVELGEAAVDQAPHLVENIDHRQFSTRNPCQG